MPAFSVWGVELGLLSIGLIGQSMFFCRFLVQWVVSERQRRSVIPISFWYISIAGGLLTLVYGILRKEPIIVLGQTVGTFVYVRNLYLIRLNARPAD